MTTLEFGPEAREALADMNRGLGAPALSTGALAAEVSAKAHLRAHGHAGFDSLSTVQRDALLAILLAPADGVREAARKRTSITSWSELLRYAHERFAGDARESFAVVFLDKKNQFIAEEVMNVGTVDHAPVYPREVVRRALELSASAIILMHNHPSGDPSPSAADVDMTRQVMEACRALKIAVHDHLVIGRDGVASLKALGLM